MVYGQYNHWSYDQLITHIENLEDEIQDLNAENRQLQRELNQVESMIDGYRYEHG